MPAPKKTPRAKLPPVSDQMKAWSSALAAEVADWPKVSIRNGFFGFRALYRANIMFAALPRTRAMRTPNSLFFKLEKPGPALNKRLEGDLRVESMQMKNVQWFTFEISSDSDLHGALEWIGMAYQSAGKRDNSKK